MINLKIKFLLIVGAFIISSLGLAAEEVVKPQETYSPIQFAPGPEARPIVEPIFDLPVEDEVITETAVIPETSGPPALQLGRMIPFIQKGEFPGSCGTEGSELSNSDANTLPYKSSVGKHYFFFSLSTLGKGVQALNFYKDKNLSGAPVYSLGSEGLLENGKNICKWHTSYSENKIFANYLPACIDKKHQFLGYASVENSRSWIKLCAVINVEEYEIDPEGKYSYKIQIGVGTYYLDVSKMPGLQSGKSFLSQDKRAQIEIENESNRLQRNAQYFTKIRDSEGFKKFHECFLSKRTSCMENYLPKNFLESVATAGDDKICLMDDSPESKKGLKCNESYDAKIREAAYGYVAEFIKAVMLLKYEKATFVDEPKGFRLEYETEKPHTKMFQGVFEVEFIDGGVRFSFLSDGTTC